MSKELEARLRGRAQFCADRKEIKTPELLTEAADQLERYRVALESVSEACDGWDIDRSNVIARAALEPKP